MNIENKIKNLLDQHTPGTVFLASWLETLGISRALQQRYKSSGWLEPMGHGAYIRPKDNITWQSALASISKQTEAPVHVGATTALAVQGFSHYLKTEGETVHLFSHGKYRLPKWYLDFNWGVPIKLHQITSIPQAIGVAEQESGKQKMTLSSPERAMIECLLLTPKSIDMVECYHLMESLVNLRPALLQELLEGCTSVKAKRMFLFLAEKINHQWFEYLDVSEITLGSGDRHIVASGAFDSKYHITVPKELIYD